VSETLSRSSRKTLKSTCRRCNRTVIVIEIAGAKVETDPELINVIPLEGAPAFRLARRAHADLCPRYQIEAEKLKLRAEMKIHAKRPRPGPGRGEPGQ
jgi:hypothetical protein